MPELSQREKILVSLMLVMVIALLGVLIFKKLQKFETQIQTQLSSSQRQLKEVNQLINEWNALKAEPTSPTLRQPLSSFVENTARYLQMHERLQLNVLKSPPEGMEGVQVKINQINLDQLFGILFVLEGNKPVILVEQLEIGISPGSRLLRASFRVFKQKR